MLIKSRACFTSYCVIHDVTRTGRQYIWRWRPEVPSPSLCRGITCISEDSSEIMFLLVENYNLTAPLRMRFALSAEGIFGLTVLLFWHFLKADDFFSLGR